MAEIHPKENFLTRLFAEAKGDRMVGAKFIAENNITQSNVDGLTPGQIATAFENRIIGFLQT